MVASYSSASSSSWRPTARALGALFAGSAVMFTTAVVQGGSLAGSENEVTPAAEPAVKDSSITSPRPSAPINSARTAAPAALAPGQAAPWTPGAKPDWGSSLAELPVRRAPVREAPPAHVATAPSSAENSGRPGGSPDEPAPGSSRFDRSPTQPAEQPDSSVIDDMLGYLSTRVGG
ncbi:MAG TPA: hypothetical protein VHH34_21330 [Pseudonocardiaceae bacterium]|nr:hypothetical protein [Pseudonocardiaceae bacterium]